MSEKPEVTSETLFAEPYRDEATDAAEAREAAANRLWNDRRALTFSALRAANAARMPMFKNAKGETIHSGGDWTPEDWLLATIGELGEACNLLKKIRRGDFSLREGALKLAQEFSDVVIYLDFLAASMGVDPWVGTSINHFNALSDYGVKFLTGSKYR